MDATVNAPSKAELARRLAQEVTERHRLGSTGVSETYARFDRAWDDAVNLAYGLLWHMQIDREDDNLRLASDARKALLSVMSKDDQLRGIDAAKATEGRFTGAA
jgi:hypothetical protein